MAVGTVADICFKSSTISYVGLGPRIDYFPPDAPICGNYAPSDAPHGARDPRILLHFGTDVVDKLGEVRLCCACRFVSVSYLHWVV